MTDNATIGAFFLTLLAIVLILNVVGSVVGGWFITAARAWWDGYKKRINDGDYEG